MANLSGFTRPGDPIDSAQLATKVTAAIGKSVNVEITPIDVIVTGVISESDRLAIQTAITNYTYVGVLYGAAMFADDDSTLSADSANRVPTQRAVKNAMRTKSSMPVSVTRSFNTNYQPSVVSNTLGTYAVECAATLSLSSGQTGTVFFETSVDGIDNWTEISRFTNGNTGTLSIGLNLTQTITGIVSGVIPQGSYARLRTSGAAMMTYRSGRETAI